MVRLKWESRAVRKTVELLRGKLKLWGCDYREEVAR